MNSANSQTTLPAIATASTPVETNTKKPLIQRPGSASAIISSARSIVNQKTSSKPSTPRGLSILTDKKSGAMHLPKLKVDKIVTFQQEFKSRPSTEVTPNPIVNVKPLPKAPLNLYEVIGSAKQHPKEITERLDGILTPPESSTTHIRQQLRQSITSNSNINSSEIKAISEEKEKQLAKVAKNALTFGNAPLTHRSRLKIQTLPKSHSNAEMNSQSSEGKKLSGASQSFS